MRSRRCPDEAAFQADDSTAEHGLERLRDRPDVIAFDGGMPEVDGYRSMRRVRTRAPTS